MTAPTNDIIHDGEFKERFRDKLDQYQTLFRFVPLTGVHLEEMVFWSLRGTGGVKTLGWAPGSHGAGKDITVNGIRCSIKSCGLPAKDGGLIEYSSYRTTKLRTIREKIEYIDDSHYDRLICLCRRDFKKNGKDRRFYSLREFDHPSRFGDMVWREEEKNFVGSHPNWSAVIRKSRSDQLLVYVPPASTKVIAEFEFTRESLQ